MALLPRSRRRAEPAMPSARVVEHISRWLAPWHRLSSDEQARLRDLTEALMQQFRWEAANGYEITDEMRVAISAHAALLVLALDDGVESYHDVSSVIVHPSTIVRHGDRYLGDGMHSDSPDPLIGEAHHLGPVLISWDAAAYQARHPRFGENVLLHEFAHRLDMLDGISDGTPLLGDDAELARWVAVCTRTLDQLRLGAEPSVLRSYAATNPAEFFAVATEVFFTLPEVLRDENPELYEVLRAYYRQDPAAR